MKCPNCNETLLMSEKSGIEIDYCPSCRGVWLDRGELDKIIERASAPYSRKEIYTQDYQKESYQGQHYDHKRVYHKKKESFLGDLFDF